MNIHAEIWKDIPGFLNYQVSSLGRVKSKRRQRACEKIKTTSVCNGYYRLGLFNGSKIRHNEFVHRLVLLAFVGPQPEGCEASHIDGCRTNNVLENLVWETKKENHARKEQHGTWQWGENNPHHKLTVDGVKEILSTKGNTLRLAVKFGVNRATIQKVRKGKSWKPITN